MILIDIIVEELDKCIDDYYRESHPIEEIAKSILAKLDTISESVVREICERVLYSYMRGHYLESTGKYVSVEKVMDELVGELSQLAKPDSLR